MTEEEPTIIDLSKFPQPEDSAAETSDIEPEDVPPEGLGFVLTPMDPEKRQVIPDGPELWARMTGYGVSTDPGYHLRWQSENDKLKLGGVAPLVTDEDVTERAIYMRPTVKLLIGLRNFTESPELRVILSLTTIDWTPEDGWAQFFIDNKLVAKESLAQRQHTVEKVFPLTGRHTPNQNITFYTRLAVEEEKIAHVLFNSAQVRVYDPA